MSTSKVAAVIADGRQVVAFLEDGTVIRGQWSGNGKLHWLDDRPEPVPGTDAAAGGKKGTVAGA